MRKVIKFVFFLLLFDFASNLFGQQVLSNLNTSWTNVLPGSIITEPGVTSYGFCTVTDDRMLSAFSSNGVLLWEKKIDRTKNCCISSLPEDFILYMDFTNNYFKLFNPSGAELWKKNIDYSITSVMSGRDGRFFITGKNKIECYGINGKRKWFINTDIQKKLPMQELPDGSIIVFLNEEKNQTKGLRISPFGEILEEITFAGEVTSAFTCQDGILLVFRDGAAGLFSIDVLYDGNAGESYAKNVWVLNKKNTSATFVVSDNKKDYLYIEYLTDGIILNKIDKSKGVISHSIKVKDIIGSKIDKIFFDESGILFTDNKNAGLYTIDGRELWYAKLPEKTSKSTWNYILYTKDNHLIFCYKNWTLNAYRTAQGKNTKSLNTETNDYNFYVINQDIFDVNYRTTFSDELISDDRIKLLLNGDYQNKERIYQNEIISICNNYSVYLSTSDFGTRKEKSIYEQDSAGFEKILNQLVLFGNKNSQNLAASILGKTQNKSFQRSLLNGISINGYDPDGKLLAALEKIAKNTSYKDKTIINNICDAVYSICQFMGRPAYNSKGKEILKNFLYPSYDAKNRDYARDTLKKIIELDL